MDVSLSFLTLTTARVRSRKEASRRPRHETAALFTINEIIADGSTVCP